MAINRRTFVQASLSAAALGAPLGAFAQDKYPSKPVTILVPFGAGTGPDTIARLLAHHLGKNLGGNFIVENKVGANGAIGAQAVANADPAGYTLMLGTNTTQAANVSLMKAPGYDPLKDFSSISRLGEFPLMLVVPASLPVKTFKEFLAYAKANPGKMSWGSANTGTQLSGITMQKATGIDVVHIPYKSSAQVVQDIMGGNIQFMFIDLATGLPHVKSGALRVLASASRERPKLLPDVPTLHEEGLTDFDIGSWAAFYAPAKTPADLRARLSAETRKIVADPEVTQRFADIGFYGVSSTPEELDRYAQAEVKKWANLVTQAGLQPQ